MCDSRGTTYLWTIYVQDMIKFTKEVLCFTRGLDQRAFVDDLRTYRATVKTIEMIGEAAAKMPASVRLSHPHIAWGDIIGTRNRVTHFYSGIDDDIIWDIIQTDIPTLIPQLGRLLEDARQDQP